MTTSEPSQTVPRPIAFGHTRPEPFRSLLERAWADEEGDTAPRRRRRRIEERPASARGRTRADRPQWLRSTESAERAPVLDDADTEVDARRPPWLASFEAAQDAFSDEATVPLANIAALEPLSPLTSASDLRPLELSLRERLPVSVGLPTSHYTRPAAGSLRRADSLKQLVPLDEIQSARPHLLTPLSQLRAAPPASLPGAAERAKILYRSALEALAARHREAALAQARLAVAHDPAHAGYRALVSDLEALLSLDRPPR